MNQTPWKFPAENREGYERVKAQGIPSIEAYVIQDSEDKVVGFVLNKKTAHRIVTEINSINDLQTAINMLRFTVQTSSGWKEAEAFAENALKKSDWTAL